MLIPTRLPGRWIWLFLVLVLMALEVLLVLDQHLNLRGWFSPELLVHAGWVSGVAIALVVMGIVLILRVDRETRLHRTMDRAMLLLVFSWVVSATSMALMTLFEAHPWAVLFRHLAYQLAAAATLNFLRTCMGQSTRLVRWLVFVQLLLGAVILFGGNLLPQSPEWVLDVWRINNVVCFTAAFLLMSYALFSGSHYPPWLTLGACLMGFGIGLSDMVKADGLGNLVSPIHGVFSGYLLMLWLLLTHRIRRGAVGSVLGGDPLRASTFGERNASGPMSSGYGESQFDAYAQDSESFRHSLAQDLHDGVGSQLVSLIAWQDRSDPKQREMARALEQCLLEVKMLGDGIDEPGDSVLDALAQLRYRVQPSLDRQGIRLIWNPVPSLALENFRDERVKQVLRIVQEALANVIRHSRAKNAELNCAYVPETEALLLTISDDGVGIESSKLAEPSGKGLLGMRRRANNMCADLELSSPPEGGTVVQLLMPLEAGWGFASKNPLSAAADHPRA